MPINGFDGLPYHLRIIPITTAATVVYANLPPRGWNISSYFDENFDNNIIHILVEPLQEPEEIN
ncbi:11472_t:CDS:2 [Diversispora eburnea]|uniref:11472_t:CDS:1 n=1 Tax=Diversispora eburnea TaxID=1213867 RepID=A0A9N9ADA0_9GLOM|nr:11472_t:CDS:2 [Diversispora eburnea]